jgi:hypothetical protein
MATLFERIVGISENKIPVHAIRAMAGEVNRGRRTFEDITTLFTLDAQQQSDLVTFLTKMSQAANKQDLSATVFDWLALAELGYMPEVYRDETQFWAAIDLELV